MPIPRASGLLLVLALFLAACANSFAAQQAVALPPGVKAEWELSKAWHESTPTRERVSINGLWRWQPGPASADRVPADAWGYFKVPGCWPGIDDYMQKDSQTVFANPAWKGQKLSEVQSAWYQREIEIPAQWTGRKIALSADYVNSLATVYLDGVKVGEIHFPAGEVELPTARPGQKYQLSLHVVALPLKGVMLSYTDSAHAREVKGSVPRRGLCGDVYLLSRPAAARIDDSRIATSIRKGAITFSAAVAGAPADGSFTLHAQIVDKDKQVAEFTSPPFKAADLVDGRFSFSAKWKPDRLWDINTPQNQYTAQISLLDPAGKVLDADFDARFGFRELWIDGKDFILNGTRIFLSAVPIDNASVGAGSANYAAARETLLRLKKIGINFVYTHNYDCEPGSHLSFDELLRAADDVGVLVALTQPHFSNYDWKSPDADTTNGYARHAAFYAHVAGNHPSVTFYSTSHNATGYDGDMDPNLIDGIHDLREKWSSNNLKLSQRVEAIINKLDPSRIVYHHAGGNNGSMHSINFYPNFAPIQELDDWFGHWSTVGVKPLFLCEYGAPFTWDWAMYRGWYKGKREFGSAAVPWELCMAEWNSQFLGDKAFAVSDMEKANLRWEAKKFAAGETWHRWDYPTEMGSPRFADRHTVLAMYTADNWRAYRTWGVSGISPWEYGHFWSLRGGVDRKREELPVDWEKLQRPGFSPDYIGDRVMQMDMAFDAADWIPTADGKAVLANNQAVLAYIAGKTDEFTEKGHNFFAGQKIEKQLIIINNSRVTVHADCTWLLQLPKPIEGKASADIETGQQVRVPVNITLPQGLAAGSYVLKMTALIGGSPQGIGQGQTQSDTFTIDVLPPPSAEKIAGRIALFDPMGTTGPILDKLGISASRIKSDADLSAFNMLIVGKFALSPDGPAPDISVVRDGLKVVVFEQSQQTLEKRLGFRAEEYGLRDVFERIPDHPIFAGLNPENLRDWRGDATTVPPKLDFKLVPMHGPTVQWCDIPVSRVWRCGTRGSVASVLIEKPARGDFLPIVDGGYSLQFSPLLEYHEARGMILFCQMDVTGRTEEDPAAQTLVRNLLRYVSSWKSSPRRAVTYAGDAAGQKYLEALGLRLTAYDRGDIDPSTVLVLSGSAPATHMPDAATIGKFTAARGRVLAIALDQKLADAYFPGKFKFTQAEHINSVFNAPAMNSPLAGVGPADAYNRGPKKLPLLSAGATIIGDGSLGFTLDDKGRPSIVFCQIAPWQVEPNDEPNLRRTFRRSACLLTRLLADEGVAGEEPMLARFHTAVKAGQDEKRWAEGFYMDQPEEWDDPYRFFRW
ncbi:MAG TPA: hypothetical protein VFE47_19155 [Tepidisphaeraceae bacterium]|jgi:hypothetical protein|nr:hypothetical protein [Tepidisphaeraceae bacterium]